MSDGSQSSANPQPRPLRGNERDLLHALLSPGIASIEIDRRLSNQQVEDMSDGGMGSIRFVYADRESRHFGKAIAEAEYLDQDGVPVSITVNLDDKGDLFELEFWKVDFNPLARFPEPKDVKMPQAGRPRTALSEPAIASHR